MKHKKLKKALDILGWIVIAPVFLIFLLLCWVFGLDTDFEWLSDKELVGYMLLVYGVTTVLVLLYFSPPLYLPPNLAIIALFLGIGGPIIGILALVIYTKMKKTKRARAKKKKTAAWQLEYELELELEDHFMELWEQRYTGIITEEEYEEKRKKLLEGLKELKKQLGSGAITQEEYEQKKKLLEKSKNLTKPQKL